MKKEGEVEDDDDDDDDDDEADNKRASDNDVDARREAIPSILT